MKYKIGLDLGSTSLGWAVVELNENNDPIKLLDLGVRIFPDGRDAKTHTPINVERRQARCMRRRNDRVEIRKRNTLRLIHEYGLDFDIKSDPELFNPYDLRAKALSEKLLPSELGRVLFHFALRRGFKSNRKETRGESGGKLKNATTELLSQMGNKTLGQFQSETKKYRFSNQFNGTVIKDGALYPTRAMYLEEFNKICTAQNLPTDMQEKFRNVIFYQRKLLPPTIGFCLFEPSEKRAHKFEPVFQKCRVLQQINQLKIINQGESRDLTSDQREIIKNISLVSFDGVVRAKNGRVKLSFAKVKKALGLKKEKFNLESEKRPEMELDTTAFAFHEIGMDDFWNSLTETQQSEILHKINNEQIEDSEIIDFLVNTCNLSHADAEKIIEIPLEENVGQLSVKALNKILPFLEQGQLYHEACASAGYNHSEQNIPELDFLPYYGDLLALKPSLVHDRTGKYRVMNATVHIALNQLRAVINEIIHLYGKPYAINIEMGRDVPAGAKERSDRENKQAKNKKENDRIRKELAEIGIMNPSREDFQKFKLWEMLSDKPQNRRCVYTGEPITSLTELFKSGKFEIEHILPFSRTLDDSMANKTISLISANKFKGNRTPEEAFTASNSPWKYEDVWQRAQSLPDATKWRFNKNALEDFLKGRSCIERAMNDTKYMTTMAVKYLQHICLNKYNVNGTKGTQTALLRENWHLDWWKNKKNSEMYRAHHIHHAVDAFIIACTSNKTLETIAQNAKNVPDNNYEDKKGRYSYWFKNLDVPYDSFDHVDFRIKCENTITSYRKSFKSPRADGTVGCLHEDTAYNLEKFIKNKAVMSHRESLPLTNKEIKKFEKNFKNVNPKTIEMFLSDTGLKNDTNNIHLRFLDWAHSKNIIKVKMIKSDVDITNWVPVFRTKQERDQFNTAYLNWYKEDGLSTGITNKKLKKVQKDKEDYLFDQYHNAALKAYKWYIGGNNFCADIYEIRNDDKKYPKLAGLWQTEIMSNYSAMLNHGNPMWRLKYPTARRIMRLRINDMVMASFSNEEQSLPKGIIDAVSHKCEIEQTNTVNMIFRVKKISSDGTIFLRPHYITKEDGDTKCWCASVNSLQKHNAQKIFVSPTGKLSLKQL